MNLVLPDWLSLRHQLRRKGTAERAFAGLGSRFGDWVSHGPDAPPAIVAEVEGQVAGYLGGAATVGRLWGAVVGLAVGLPVAAVIIVISWIAA